MTSLRSPAAAIRLALALGAVAGCGAGASRFTAEMRTELADDALAGARERAPELVALAEAALDDAERAERADDERAAHDHATRARLYLEAAQAEAARVIDDAERAQLERATQEVLAQARRDEEARETISLELDRLAAIRSAHEEGARALSEASVDEAQPGRRRRVSLEEDADVRRAAQARLDRASLTLTTARALGGPTDAVDALQEAIDRCARESALADRLRCADQAQLRGMTLLGEIRRTMGSPTLDEARALAEAAQADGFDAAGQPEGVVVEARALFHGTGASPTRGATRAVEKLAALIAAYPHGPVQVHVQVGATARGSEALALRRAEALVLALVAHGAPRERLSAHAVPSSLQADTPQEGARLLFGAYSVRP